MDPEDQEIKRGARKRPVSAQRVDRAVRLIHRHGTERDLTELGAAIDFQAVDRAEARRRMVEIAEAIKGRRRA